MLSNSQTKLITSLGVKKYRLQHRKFVVEGEKMVGELLAQERIAISAIFGLEDWAAHNVGLLQPFSEIFTAVTEAALGKVSSLSTPNSVLAIAEMPSDALNTELPGQDICFFLDGIQDPGNLGSILRIADWFGIPAVFCAPDTVDIFNPKVVQASMGAIFRVKSWETPLAMILKEAPETPTLGAVLGGSDVFETLLPTNGLLVIGNEGRGISPDIERLLSHRLTIPRHPMGAAESLNAAVAAGILAAIFRGRRSDGALRR